MARSIFFLYYRAGSTLFESLCGKEWWILGIQGQKEEAKRCHNKWRQSGEIFYLPTVPPCPTEDSSLEFKEAVARYQDYEHFSYKVHVGDWWGQLKGPEIKGAYDYDTFTKWGPDDLIKLGPGWKFTALIRDGRNQIESLRKIKGGIEEQLMRKDPEDYFLVLCKGFRNRARIALDCESYLSNYTIFRFEDFINDPLEVSNKMFLCVGLMLDKDAVRKNLQRIKDNTKSQSSFGEHDLVNQRWHSWSKKEIEIFKSIAGKELIELGYEEDNSW